jgi:hypothetical protein
MIVLNGEPFTRYNLRSLYSFAHQIIVVEGACRAAAAVARPDGHSADGTYELLNCFAVEEDPERKMLIVSAKDDGHEDGFWPEKDEMCWAYAKRTTGEFLWQIDSDEFYKQEDMEKVLQLMSQGIDAISFPTLTFFGGLGYKIEGFKLICDRYAEVHRVFKWGAGYQLVSHRPPTVLDESGVDVRTKNWINAVGAARIGLQMYHYCYLFPHQVLAKSIYYSTKGEHIIKQGAYIAGADRWAKEVYMMLARPYRMFIKEDSLCWLERYRCTHPLEVNRMFTDLLSGRRTIELRRTEDIERLLSSYSYRMGCFVLKVMVCIVNNPPGLFLRRYGLAFVRHLQGGTLWKRICQFCGGV